MGGTPTPTLTSGRGTLTIPKKGGGSYNISPLMYHKTKPCHEVDTYMHCVVHASFQIVLPCGVKARKIVPQHQQVYLPLLLLLFAT